MGRAAGRSAAVRRELRTDFRLMTIDFAVNAVLGSDLVPRPVRYAGYRALGMPTRTPNVLPGLRISGSRRRLTLGEGTFLNRDCFIEAVADVTVGTGCQFGPQVMVLTSHHERLPDGRIERRATPLPVVIGNRVWIGARALILPGVTIGDDVVIAAGAVVTKDCRIPGTYAGVPAKMVGAPAAVDESAVGRVPAGAFRLITQEEQAG
jgi:maltose O-acetyltransferase